MSNEINVIPQIDTTEIDIALAKLDAALERVNDVSGAVAAKTATAKIEATNLLNSEAPKIKDLEQATKRIASMIPGLRKPAGCKPP